jgi:hypothetical protein
MGKGQVMGKGNVMGKGAVMGTRSEANGVASRALRSGSRTASAFAQPRAGATVACDRSSSLDRFLANG